METGTDKITLTSISKQIEIVNLDSLHKQVEEINSTELSEPHVKNEELGNGSFLVEVKKEHKGLSWAASMANSTSTSIIKLEPEWNQVDQKQFLEDKFICEENKPDRKLIKLKGTPTEINEKCHLEISGPILPTLDECEDFSPKQIEVKTETSKIEKGLEFVECKIKHEQLDFNEEDFKQNQAISEDFSLNEREVPVKTKISETVSEIESSPEFVECKIKHEDFDLNGEDFEQNQTIVSSDGTNQEKTNNSEKHKCHVCGYQTNKKSNFDIHLLKHQKSEEILIKCDICDFKTIHKCSLKVHLLRHKSLNEVGTFKCPQCECKAISKSDLRKHLLIHHEPKEVNVFRCDKCDFKATRKRSLQVHCLRHKSLDEVSTFKCLECEYKTISKSCLKKHLLIHQDPKKVNIFKCDKCDFKTIHKSSLKVHLLRHKSVRVVGTFKCSQCEYKTLSKLDLKKHLFVDHDLKEVNVYPCDKCEFKTIHKNSLTVHLLRHKSINEVDTFKCDICSYKSIYKSHLTKHRLRHNNQFKTSFINNNLDIYTTTKTT